MNAWDLAPKCTHSYNNDGKIMSACSFSRPFEFIGANTIAVGSQLTFIVGFNKWATTSATTPLATGVSPTLKWVITDEAFGLVAVLSSLLMTSVVL